MTVSAKLSLHLAANLKGSNAFNAGPYWDGVIDLVQSFADGVTAEKVDRIYMAERTVASASNDDVDLAGVLVDALGVTITAAELVAVLIVNKKKDGTANITNLTIGGSTSGVPGFTAAGHVVKPGGVFLLMNPDATGIATVTASTGDILRVTNSSGASNTYQLAVLARTA
ncbi:hypothetical protein GGQ86_002979 [Xanthobacter flavus]|uniref:Uncharacterized protein n=1 Tax=Xanthobacter flavus TaxID=281 RepID=A0A9W6CTB0_XANFL|nr:hypothetical protein [Xanthobacter flavus]MDR6334497.1 hypothetical protein [Xanthobacter flavus]GLI23483.1 hypothetical protein XFLAVUS301_31570 [Xanthobacter flavus]